MHDQNSLMQADSLSAHESNGIITVVPRIVLQFNRLLLRSLQTWKTISYLLTIPAHLMAMKSHHDQYRCTCGLCYLSVVAHVRVIVVVCSVDAAYSGSTVDSVFEKNILPHKNSSVILRATQTLMT